MGITKNHLYTQDQIQLASLFKALGHPARIAIVEKLLTHDNLNCNDLRFYIPLAQSTISEHIKILHNVGILAVRVVGSNAYYETNKPAFEQITEYLQQLFEQMGVGRGDKWDLYSRPFLNISPHYFRNQT